MYILSFASHLMGTQSGEYLLNSLQILTDNCFKALKYRTLEYIGYIMSSCKYHLFELLIQEKIERQQRVGRSERSWMDDIKEWTGIRRVERLFRLTVDKKLFKMITNVRGTGDKYYDYPNVMEGKENILTKSAH